MSFTDKNCLSILLKKLLEPRLQRLEKRNEEQLKDLKFSKVNYKKQCEAVSKLKLIKLKPQKKIRFYYYIKKTNAQKRIKTPDIHLEKNNQTKERKLNCKTPDRNLKDKKLKEKNTIKYFKYSDQLNDKITSKLKTTKSFLIKQKNNKKEKNEEKEKNNENTSRKNNFTPEPKLRKKNKKPKKNLSKSKEKTGNNININTININTINIKTSNLHSIHSIQNSIQNSINNSMQNSIQNNSNQNSSSDLASLEYMNPNNNPKDLKNIKKTIMISDIDLSGNYTSDLLENIKTRHKEFPIFNKINNTSSDNNTITIKNIELLNSFRKWLLSSDGNESLTIIISFLDIKTKYNFFSCNKKLIRNLSFYLNDIYKNIIEINNISPLNTIQDRLNELKMNYNYEQLHSDFNFSLPRGVSQCIEYLNDDSYNNIFYRGNPRLDETVLVYRILFQFMDKNDLDENDEIFWKKFSDFIIENNDGETGTFLINCIKNFDFSGKNILKIKKLALGNEEKFIGSYYAGKCRTTMIVVNLVKEALQYSGVLENEEKNMPAVMFKYWEYINLLDNKLKEYIDQLKYY